MPLASVPLHNPPVLMSASAMATELSSKLEDGHEQEHTLMAPTDLSKWPCRSRSEVARIMIKNRRKRYLDTHPEYFASPSLELADPLAYDRLVRRFQSSSEREAEGRKKGYSGMLEADLWRSEAQMDAFATPECTAASRKYNRVTSGGTMEEKDEIPENKDDGLQRWRKEMEVMFLKGADPDFDYKEVDGNEDYDDRVVQEREAEERWFDKEEPSWVAASNHDVDRAEGLTGQTGVQDY